jgi:hypothetical protein
LKSDYKLTPLGEVAEYINKNHHLPEMPNAQTVRENGISLGDMDVTLVKKVEELTKYLIEEHNQIIEQQKLLVVQQKQIEELKEKMDGR